MDKKFKIILPPVVFKPEVMERIIKNMFTTDSEKDGLLAKVLIFLNLHEPASITEMTKEINSYYQTDLDRAVIFRILRKLSDRHLIVRVESGVIMTLSEEEKSEIHKKIETKYRNFISGIPKAFRGKYQDVNYYWVSSEGKKYIPFCCKLLNLKCEEE